MLVGYLEGAFERVRAAGGVRVADNARLVGGALLPGLRDLVQRYELIENLRDRGVILAIELVRDRQGKNPATEETAAVFERAHEEGLILSTSCQYRNVLRFVPPLCLRLVLMPITALNRARLFDPNGIEEKACSA